MGSYCHYMIGKFTVASFKYEMDASFYDIYDLKTMLFKEKNASYGEMIYFSNSIRDARRRHNLKCHITLDELRTWFRSCVDDNYEIYSYYEKKYNGNEEKIEKAILKEFTYDKYVVALKELFDLLFNKNHFDEIDNVYEKIEERRKMFDVIVGNYKDENVINMFIYDSFIKKEFTFDNENLMLMSGNFDFILKTLLITLPETLKLNFEFGEFYDSFDEKDLIELIRKDKSQKTMIVTEGSTDMYYLKPMLSYLFPTFENCFAFAPMELIESSCSSIAKYYKFLAESGIKNNCIFIFDDDVAGNEAYDALPKRDNEYIKKMTLPSCEELSSYPCFDFDGKIKNMDIRGKAISIELMFPNDCLLVNEELSPIRWETYNKKRNAYQGKISDKTIVQKNIKEFVKNPTKKPNDKEFNKLKTLFNSMIDKFDFTM